MGTQPNSPSPEGEEIVRHYASGYEAQRLNTQSGKLDRERSRELLNRFLAPAPATILDVGGGPGGHACWLAGRGYQVVDPFDEWWDDPTLQQRLLRIARALETEPSVLGISAHLMVSATKHAPAGAS